MSPTSTPEMVTPLAIVAGVVVVVPVVVVAATTPADRPPPAARPNTNSTSRPTLLIRAGSLASEDPRIVRDHAVDADLVQPVQQLRVVHRPGEHRRAERVTARHGRLAQYLPVEHGGRCA